MAELGLLDVTVLKDKSATDTSQVPASGWWINVYREGITAANGDTILDTAQGTITLEHVPGDVAVNDTFVIFDSSVYTGAKAGGLLRVVTVDSVTQLTVKALNGNVTWSSGDYLYRSTIATFLSLYSDDKGTTSKGTNNILTTDSAGRAWGFVDDGSGNPIAEVDLLIRHPTDATTTPKFVRSYKVAVPDSILTNVFDNATAVGFKVDTQAALTTTGAKILSLNTGGTEKFYVDKDGDLWTDSGVFVSDVADSATADAFVLDADNAFTTAGAKLLSLTNNSVEKYFIDKDGGFTAAAASTISAGGLTVTGDVTITGVVDVTGDFDTQDGDFNFDKGNNSKKMYFFTDVNLYRGGTNILKTDDDFTANDITANDIIANDLNFRRINLNVNTDIASTDFALSAGWGDTAAKVLTAGSHDTAGRIGAQAGGSGIAADPTITLTFKDGAFGVAPRCVVSRGDAVAPAGGYWTLSSTATTAITFKFVGTPVSGSSYTLDYLVFER
jgi:hypothetical protein